MKRLLLISLLTAAFTVNSASAAGDSTPSRASEHLSAAAGFVVIGSLSAVAVSGVVVVESVETVADGVVVVLKGASNAATASVKLGAKAAESLSRAVGTAVMVTAVSTGFVLVMSGKAIAFIPNEIGTALLHHSRVEL
ncbi:hypothetical protein [Pseudoduganella namucuonensis]|uniref:Uncharacterized protein n=1 Tax=Pseudoduganella namucuonensis TaxID=1035707 RepID=A0A1I7IXK7_9BURK|nr:hypothetical protein [Pseudoduganella namucuonensis]SFU77697.1 hypothetical protein SAMN05216552_1009140 [Pseudoduganella namucuonensis]